MERPDDWQSEWTDKQAAAVSTVCSSYDAAAMLVTTGLSAQEPFTSAWGPSIVHCFNVSEPYLRYLRSLGSGRTYWEHFERMAGIAAVKLGIQFHTGGEPGAEPGSEDE